MPISPKIRTVGQLARMVTGFKKKNLKIVLAHGVFDLVHWGHIHYFKEAKKLGDILIVSVVNDKFVNKSDVPKRPLMFGQKTRISWLAELQDVDFVVLCNDLGPWKIMKAVKPDFYAKGDDSKHRLKNVDSGLKKDKELIESLGGKLIFTKSLPVHSTDIINNLVK